MKLVSVYVFVSFCVFFSFGWLVNASTVAEYYTNLKMNGTNEVKENVNYEEFPDYNTESIVDNKENKNGTIDSGKNETIKENKTDSGYSNKTNPEDKKENNFPNNNQTMINNSDTDDTKKDIIPIEPYDSSNSSYVNNTNATDIIPTIIPKENNTNSKTPNDNHNNSQQYNNSTILYDNSTKPHHKKKKSHMKKLNKELTSQIFEQFLKYTNQLISEKPPQKEIPKNDTSTVIITSSTNTTINTKKEMLIVH